MNPVKACVAGTLASALFTALGYGVLLITGDPNMLVGSAFVTGGMFLATLGTVWIFKDEE